MSNMPPRTFIIDVESYYADDYHLNTQKKGGLSYPAYIHDERFHAHGMAVDDGRGQHWVDHDDIPDVLHEMRNDILVAHNGFFDFGVLAWHYKFLPAYMVDTLLLANHVLGSARDQGGGGNDVASLALRLGLDEEKGKIDLRGVRHPSEAQMAALAAYAKKDARLERKILDKLLPEVSNQDLELWLLDHTMRIYVSKPLPVDREKIDRTVVLINKLREERLAAGGVPQTVLSSNKQFGEELTKRLTAAGVTVPMKQGAKGPIPALAKGDGEFIKLIEHDNPEISNLVRARLVERSTTQALARLGTLEKYDHLGGIPVHLIYYGAHTGRFAGGGGFNFQNLTNPERAIDPVDREIADSIRGSITPGEGNVFVAVDAAQIEPRTEAWLAGEQSILDAFATGADLYSDFISEVLGEDIHKPTKAEEESKPQLAKRLKLMRQVGKESVLGLGYQMGTPKFFDRLKNGGNVKSRELAKFVESGGFTLDMAEKTVKHYRDSYPNIVEFWDALNEAFHTARRGRTKRVGFLEFSKIDQRAVAITLPSSRRLYYRDIRAERDQNKKKFFNLRTRTHETRIEWKHGGGQKVYGGLLAENVTQAVARDILVEQGVYASEVAGYPVALHIHDEVVSVTKRAEGEKALAFLIKSLSTAPPWAPGIVLSAEGRVGNSLAKS